jgi:hypothetical protein
MPIPVPAIDAAAADLAADLADPDAALGGGGPEIFS